MSTKFSVRGLLRSRRSKKAEKLGVQDGGHQPDDATTPPVASGSSHAKNSISQHPSVTSFTNRQDSTESASSVTPPVTDQGIYTSLEAKAKRPESPASAAQGTLKVPSSHIVQAQVPASALLVTDAKANPAEPDPRIEEPQPTTDFAVQQIQVISTSQRLWNEAYDSLEDDNETAELVKAYVNTLTTVFKPEKAHDTFAPGAGDVSTALKDPTKRQTYMKTLLEEGQAKVFKASNITKGVGDIAKFILSAKGLVDVAIQNIPQAALPWAGVCIGLQILLNPAKATRSNLAGIVYVTSSMDWYCSLTEHLLKKENVVVRNESFEAILQKLEKTVVELYKALLLYQMKSVCSYYRNQGLVFLRSLANLDGWDDDLESVKDTEAVLQKYSDHYNNLHAKSLLGHLVESAKERQSILGDIRQDLREFIAQQQNAQIDDKNKELLRDLFVVDPQSELRTILKKKDNLVDEAYKWILHTKEYTRFIDWTASDDESEFSPCRLFWINGPAGTGKTMLLIGIIREFSDQPCILAPSLSYFFCQGTGDKTLNNATATLRSLIWLLLIQQPHLISHLKSKYEHTGPSLFSDRNAFSALSDAFTSMLKDPSLSPTYLVVDALDECDQGLSELVELISSSLALSDKVKWLVSSRPEVELKNRNTLSALVELDSQLLEDPVNAYIEHKLISLRGRDGYYEDTLAKISSEVRQRATNTFLWVALVFKALDSVEGWDAVHVIEEIPSGLSELYSHMMTRIENGSKENQQRCKNVLVAALLAYRPLSLSELAVLAGLLPRIKPETIVKKCGSFLTIKNKIVYLIHQSAKDYFEENYTSKLQQNGTIHGHEDIFRRSIGAMSKRLEKNIYNLQHVGFKSEDLVAPSPDPLEGLRYCCVHWVQHFQKSSIQLYDNDNLHQFIEVHLLHWLEALGWIRKVSEGILAILSLEALILAGQAPNLYAFFHDAKRFALHNRSLIEQTPLQLYCSALVFAPKKSIIRRQFENYIPTWIEAKLEVKANWDAMLQTLEGHTDWVSSVAFSPDGKLIGSGSDDGTVRLWDATTGATLQTLKGHEGYIRSVAFSPDSKVVVSGSKDKTVRLWDAATGALLQTLRDHEDYVTSTAFSPNSKLIVSGSYDNTVRLWDVATGALLQTLRGHESYVTSTAFSPNSKLVVSGSGDCTVRLWDVATGATQKLKGHTSWVRSVAFSPDGKQVVSGSDDCTVRLWDVATGAVQKLEGHTDPVSSVAFSPDGKQVVSGSDDSTVRLWDVATGAVQKLEGHTDLVSSVAFSPDGKQVVSGSDDSTVRLWDVATGATQKLEGHTNWVGSVAFSSDGKQVVSGSGDSTVRLWDVATGAVQKLEGHTDPVSSVAFSPDGKQVVSGSSDCTVRLWDVATGAVQKLEGHTNRVGSVAFSPDGKQVVSGSNDKTVRLWEAATGAELQTFEFSTWNIRADFLPDGKLVVSSLDDEAQWLCDTTTGKAKTFKGYTNQQLAFLRANDWVVEGDRNTLWLPHEYRPYCQASRDNVIVLGHQLGGISYFRFQEGSRQA